MSDDGPIQEINMSVIGSVTPIYEIIEPDENHLQNDPLNLTFEQLNMGNSSSIDLSKIDYNQDPSPSNAQTSMNHATQNQQETHTNEFIDFENSQSNKHDPSHNVKEVSKTKKSDSEYHDLMNEMLLKVETGISFRNQ